MGADRQGVPVTSQIMNYLRRCRFLPLQLLVVLLVVLCYLAMNMLIFKREPQRSVWESREDELKKFDDKEFDINYVRKMGVTDSKIENIKDDRIDEMNETELIVNVHSFLDNADITCSRRIRMGYVGEGGWEICDDEGVRPKKGSCLVYSFGVTDHTSFEEDVARVYGCQVHTFNAYLDGDDYNKSSNLFVHSYSLGRYSEIAPDGKELYAFDDIKTLLGHSKKSVDIIKIDTEGGEWPALNGMLEEGNLKNIKQMLVEFHVGMPSSEDRLRRQLRVLRAISRVGFRKFYVYKNARGGFHHPGFPVMRARQYEVHYVNTRFLDD